MRIVTTTVQHAYEMWENLTAALVWLTHCFMGMHMGRRSQCIYKDSAWYIWFAIVIRILSLGLSSIGVSYICGTNMSCFGTSIYTRGQHWPSGIVIVCICVFVSTFFFIRAITHHTFQLESSNLDKKPYNFCLRTLFRLDWLTPTFQVK